MKNKYKDEIVMRIINEDVSSIIIRTVYVMRQSVEDVFEYFLLPKYCYYIDYNRNDNSVLVSIDIKMIKYNNFLYDYQLKNVLNYFIEDFKFININYCNGIAEYYTPKDFTYF